MEYQNESMLNAEIKKSFAEYNKIIKDSMTWGYEDLNLEDAQHLVEILDDISERFIPMGRKVASKIDMVDEFHEAVTPLVSFQADLDRIVENERIRRRLLSKEKDLDQKI